MNYNINLKNQAPKHKQYPNSNKQNAKVFRNSAKQKLFVILFIRNCLEFEICDLGFVNSLQGQKRASEI